MSIFLKTICIYFLQLVRIMCLPFLKKPLSVLCYHAIDEEDDWKLRSTPVDFENQISLLKQKGVSFCSADELLAYVSGKKICTTPTVHITFDDGYESVLTHALPILQKYHVPATVFVMGDFAASIKQRGTSRSGLPESQIKTLQESGLVTIGYHGKTHKLLDSINGSELRDEIAAPFTASFFAYPGGHKNQQAVQALAEYGYQLAFAISGGLVTKRTHPLLIPRTVVSSEDRAGRVYIYTTHAWHWFLAIRRLVKKFV